MPAPENASGAAKVEIERLDVVALLEDVPAHGLVRGQVGESAVSSP